MAMDLDDPNVWISHLLENLPEDKVACALRDEDEEWEYIDGEIVKLGSLTHSQLDIPELQRRGLVLLASESKDFRLLAHLLRTLQHTGDPLLAMRLLAMFVEHYWTLAAPQNMAHKKRFAAQVMKRFEAGIAGFADNAGTEQRDELPKVLARLAQCWQVQNAPELAQATDDLLALYQRALNGVAPALSSSSANTGTPSKTVVTPERDVSQNTSAPQISIDSHDDTAWRGTLHNVATILCERLPDSPLGYRLHRHALWLTITSAPQVESDGRTPLAAVSADMVADYQARLASADMALLLQVEKSILRAPYWLDGHHLSAQTALRLGYKQVAEAIQDEAVSFLERLPALTDLMFNDRTPFISEQTKQWLATSSSGSQAVSAQPCGEELQAARACYTEQGLEAALRYLDSLPEGDPRYQFHRQYFGAQLMEESGMEKLAQQQYRMLFRTGFQIALADWEPSLFEQLKQKFTAEQ